MTVRIPSALKSLRVAAAALSVVAALVWSVPAGAQSAPFGSHKQRYAQGVLKPSLGQRKLDRQTAAFYAKWKAAYLRAGCKAGHHYVKADAFSGATVVSEGQGYGMLIVAMMAGEEPDARTIFDGLYRYYLDHPSEVDPDLMAWAQDADCKNILGPSSATDGDLDVAYALLLAHRQWGSTGVVDYLGGAERVLKALMRSNVTKKTWLTNLGDWAKVGDPKYRFATRSSDWMPGHFRAFAKRDEDWRRVLKASVRTAAQLQAAYAPATGLLPDFVIDADTAAKPADPGFLEGENDGRYGYNACRDPWRFGVDAAIDGAEASAKVARKMSRWARRAASDKPGKLRDGYELDGSPTVEYQSMSFVAPFAVAATVDRDAQKWLDALWGAMVSTAPEGYYPDSIRMLSMLAVSRNWLTP